jgi:hypothetical protein
MQTPGYEGAHLPLPGVEAAVGAAGLLRGRRGQDRMEFDSVRSDTRLPVLVVEEGDADHTGSGASAPRPSGRDHLLAPSRRCTSCAERRGRFGNHRA